MIQCYILHACAESGPMALGSYREYFVPVQNPGQWLWGPIGSRPGIYRVLSRNVLGLGKIASAFQDVQGRYMHGRESHR